MGCLSESADFIRPIDHVEFAQNDGFARVVHYKMTDVFHLIAGQRHAIAIERGGEVGRDQLIVLGVFNHLNGQVKGIGGAEGIYHTDGISRIKALAKWINPYSLVGVWIVF